MKAVPLAPLWAFLACAATPLGVAGQSVSPGVVGPTPPTHRSVVHGVVEGEAGRPLADVLVEARLVAPAGGEARTDGPGVDVGPSAPPDATGRSGPDGAYEIAPLPAGRVQVRFRRLGYREEWIETELRPGERARLDVRLAPAAIRLGGLEVGAVPGGAHRPVTDDAGPGPRTLSGEAVRTVPGLAEADPLRAVQTLPGVVAPSDLSASYNVRGGAADQNLILLDGFPLFNPFHLGGVFSVFNADLIRSVELRTGGFAPEFGGRVSSVLAITSDPGPGERQLDAGLSMLALRVAVSGGADGLPGLRDGRWRLSGRRSYVDRLLRPVAELPYAVTDLQGSFEAWRGDRTRVALTGYSGRDVLDLARLSRDDVPLRLHWGWGNDLAGAGVTHLTRGGSRVELRLGASRFASRLRFSDFADSEFGTRIEHWLARAAVHRPAGRAWDLGAGVDLDRYAYRKVAASGGTDLGGGSGSGGGVAPWAQAEWRPSPAWLLAGGVRLEGWDPERGHGVWVPSPRVSVKRHFAAAAALHLSGGRYVQFAQSLRDEELPLGIDVWVLAESGTPHLVSDQVQAGLELAPGPDWFLAADAYLRRFDGVITPNPASDPNRPNDDVLGGRGRAMGVDLFVERAAGRVTGSVSASWMKAERSFPDVRSGRADAPPLTFPPVFDRRFDVDAVLRFPLPRSWRGSARWHVGSGLPYTRPLTRFAYFEPRHTDNGRLRWQGGGGADGFGGEDRRSHAIALGPRNAERYPVYHRLDLSVRRTFHPSWGAVTPYLDLLNVYNQSNVLFYFYDFAGDPPTRSGLTMFPFLPTFGVEVNW